MITLKFRTEVSQNSILQRAARLGVCHLAPALRPVPGEQSILSCLGLPVGLSRLWPHKQPANPIAFLALLIAPQSITCARGAFLPVVPIHRASNDTPTALSICSLAAGLTDARVALDWRSAFCASAYWHLSSAHNAALSRSIVPASGLAPAARSRELCGQGSCKHGSTRYLKSPSGRRQTGQRKELGGP